MLTSGLSKLNLQDIFSAQTHVSKVQKSQFWRKTGHEAVDHKWTFKSVLEMRNIFEESNVLYTEVGRIKWQMSKPFYQNGSYTDVLILLYIQVLFVT